MAERRMFSKSVIGSARFLRMPSSSRLLYYDLGMQADDDGVVEAFAVMRTTGATEDDLRVLSSKGFVTVLNDDLVSLICDWSKNNLIKKDRYHPSIYQSLLVQLEGGTKMVPDGFQAGSTMEPEDRLGKDRLGKDRLGKDRLGKDRLGKDSIVCISDKPKRTKFVPPTVEQVAEYVKERGSKVVPQDFIDFYESKDWMVGKNRMKDWKAACRRAENWECWDKKPKQNTVKEVSDYGNSEYDLF